MKALDNPPLRRAPKRKCTDNPSPAKKHHTRSVQSTAPQLQREDSSTGILWVKPEYNKLRQITLPQECLSGGIHCRVDSKELIALVEEHHFTEMVYTDKSPIAGTGVFATRAYAQGEFIGFYKGRIVKHQKIDDDVLTHFKQQTDTPQKSLPKNIYVCWQDNNGTAKFIKSTDSHTLWTYAYLDESPVEVGIDGLQAGNALAYMNHSPTPNVIPFTVASKEITHDRSDLFSVKSGQYNSTNLMSAVVAIKPIKAKEELTFDYAPRVRRIDFNKVGYDIFQHPELYYNIDQDRISRKTFPPKEAFLPYDEVTPLFEQDLSDDDKQLLNACKNNNVHALKKLTDAVLAGEEQYINLYILYSFFYRKISITDMVWSGHLSLLRRFFPNVHALKTYIVNQFPSVDSSRMLWLAEEPGQMQRTTLETTATSAELAELVRRIKSEDPESKEALKEYIFCRVYRTKSIISVSQQCIFQKMCGVLGDARSLLGKPGKDWHPEDFYKFAVEEGIFLNDVERIAYMPLTYFRLPFSSDPKEDKQKRLKALNEYCCQQFSKGCSPRLIAVNLSRCKVPNPFRDNPSTNWQEADVYYFDSANLMRGVVDTESYEEHLQTWLNGSKSKQTLEEFETLKVHIQNGTLPISYLIYRMRCHGKTIEDIAHRLRQLKSDIFKGYTRDKIRKAIFQHLPKNTAFSQQAAIIGSAIDVAHLRVLEAQEEPGFIQFDSLFSEEDLRLLAEELDECYHPSYTTSWYNLLREWPVPCLYRLFLANVVPRDEASTIVMRFNRGDLPITPSASSDQVVASEWTKTTLFTSLYDHGLFELRNKYGLSIAVNMAAELPNHYSFKDVYINEEPFSTWIKKEVNDRTYSKAVKSKLMDKKYIPDTRKKSRK